MTETSEAVETPRFSTVLDHFGLLSSRIQPGEAHENGVVEKGHDLLKRALDQALRLRGSRDFPTVAAYLDFVAHVVERDLHAGRAANVPSRLIGHRVDVHLHLDVLEVRCAGKLIETIPRLRGPIMHRIDYPYVICSLARKPGAFAQYRYREDLFPSLTFRRAYDSLRERRGDRADVEYVRVLHLAASTSEALVESALERLLEPTSGGTTRRSRRSRSPRRRRCRT